MQILVFYGKLANIEIDGKIGTKWVNPLNIYLFKLNNGNTGKKCEIRSELTIETPEQRHWRRSGFYIVNFEYISHHFLLLLLMTLNK